MLVSPQSSRPATPEHLRLRLKCPSNCSHACTVNLIFDLRLLIRSLLLWCNGNFGGKPHSMPDTSGFRSYLSVAGTDRRFVSRPFHDGDPSHHGHGHEATVTNKQSSGLSAVCGCLATLLQKTHGRAPYYSMIHIDPYLPTSLPEQSHLSTDSTCSNKHLWPGKNVHPEKSGFRVKVMTCQSRANAQQALMSLIDLA